MKVLFLDIDGVLNSERSSLACDGYPHSFVPDDLDKFDWIAVSLVRKLCNVASCSIVLSSSWRLQFTVEEAVRALDLPIIGATPDHGDYDSRATEIHAWLAAHPEVERYAIVDDIPQFRTMPELQAKFVQTDPALGLSLSDYRQLRHLLQPDTP